jgi:hypothetical protein
MSERRHRPDVTYGGAANSSVSLRIPLLPTAGAGRNRKRFLFGPARRDYCASAARNCGLAQLTVRPGDHP